MKLEKHILYAFDDYFAQKQDSALMHACMAIDATAKKFYSHTKSSKRDYKNLIRNYYWIIEPMIGAGLNLEETKWGNLEIDDGYGKIIEKPDFADVIYHVFRCNDAHAQPIPKNYGLLPTSDGHSKWHIADNVLYMPDRVIWALISVSVFSKANADVKTDGDYYLSWGSESLGMKLEKFVLRDWWGREDDLRLFFAKQNIIRVKLENLSFK